MGLLDGVFGSSPDHQNIPLDANTKGMLSNTISNANKDTSAYADKLNANTTSPYGMLQSQDQAARTNSRLGGMDGNTFGAIRNAYGQQAGEQVNDLVKQNDLQSKLNKADYLNKVGQAVHGQQVNIANQYKEYTQAYTQQQEARAGAINSLFQLGSNSILRAGLNKPPPQQPTFAGENYQMPTIGAGANPAGPAYSLAVGGGPQGGYGNALGNYSFNE